MIESIFTGMQEKQKEVIKLASKLYVEKLKLSKDIFGLAEELAKLDEIDKRGESSGHATQDHCGERGQECRLCSLGCRSKVYLSGDAALGYCTGYRLIRLSGRAYKKPDELAGSRSYEYIAELHRSVLGNTERI